MTTPDLTQAKVGAFSIAVSSEARESVIHVGLLPSRSLSGSKWGGVKKRGYLATVSWLDSYLTYGSTRED